MATTETKETAPAPASAESTTPSEELETSPGEVGEDEALSVDNPQAQGQLVGKDPSGKGRTGRKKEVLSVILPGMWVRLGDTKNVPEYVQGHIAAVHDVVVGRNTDTDDPVSPRDRDEQAEDAPLTVVTRDEYNATLSITRDDVAEVFPNGRPLRG